MYLTKKAILQSILGSVLKIEALRKIWIKAIEATLLTKDLQGFKQSQILFLDLLRKVRFHLIITQDNVDVDLTYIKIQNNNVKHDHQLFRLVQDSCAQIQQMLKSDFKDPENQVCFLNSRSAYETIFESVPELRAGDNHYLFLNSLAISTNAKRIIDLGTASGSSLCAFLSAKNVEFVNTFDIRPLARNSSWVSVKSEGEIDRFLSENYQRWKQHVVNLESVENWNSYRSLFYEADLILIDTQHRGSFESLMGKRFVAELSTKTIFIWDDIRLSSMCDFWDSLEMRKLDIGGIGHISGTGVSVI
jgi:hypothetical protein